MRFTFTKMHGLGNDFVLLDARAEALDLTPAQFAQLADRRYGVGCDQVLVIDRSTLPDALARYRIFNADGSPAEHCGNGVRCVAKYLHDRGDVTGGTLKVEIGGRACALALTPSDDVRVDMGVPRFAPRDIPLAVDAESSCYAVTFEQHRYEFGAVSIGNPHAVFEVPDVDTAPVTTLGAFLQKHALFPARVNVGFMQVLSPEHIRLRVFERGVGETPACGTGACGAVAIGIRAGRLAPRVTVELRGGTLAIAWGGGAEPLYMTGPATTVFVGSIEL